MPQSLRDFPSSEAFIPRGHCYQWEPALVWLQVVADLAIGLACVALAVALAYLAKKGRPLPRPGAAVAFGIFIVSCGVTHVLDVVVIWEPVYWLEGTLRAITAVASVATALLLLGLVPRALELVRGARAMQERGVGMATALADLGRLYERTEELERLKAEFFAGASHELRTPLTLMLGPAERLLASGALDPGQRRDVELIVHNGRVLLEHVNDLLDAARLEDGRLAPTYARVELDRLVRRVTACFEGIAEDARITYAVEVPSPLVAEVDPDELGRVLLNLLSNAFDHAPAGGIVRCVVSVLEAEPGERVRIEVSDSGPGIAPADRERAFARFGRGTGSARRDGTGLGLAIAKDFVELHRGTIAVVDAPEGGARVVVELPRHAPPGTEIAPVVEPALVQPLEREPAPASTQPGAGQGRHGAEALGAHAPARTAEPGAGQERLVTQAEVADVLRLVSHELHAPLATLWLQLDRLQGELGHAPGPSGRIARRMLGSAGRLRELVDGLRDGHYAAGVGRRP